MSRLASHNGAFSLNPSRFFIKGDFKNVFTLFGSFKNLTIQITLSASQSR